MQLLLCIILRPVRPLDAEKFRVGATRANCYAKPNGRERGSAILSTSLPGNRQTNVINAPDSRAIGEN
jgi:hypothetical protein